MNRRRAAPPIRPIGPRSSARRAEREARREMPGAVAGAPSMRWPGGSLRSHAMVAIVRYARGRDRRARAADPRECRYRGSPPGVGDGAHGRPHRERAWTTRYASVRCGETRRPTGRRGTPLAGRIGEHGGGIDPSGIQPSMERAQRVGGQLAGHRRATRCAGMSPPSVALKPCDAPAWPVLIQPPRSTWRLPLRPTWRLPPRQPAAPRRARPVRAARGTIPPGLSDMTPAGGHVPSASSAARPARQPATARRRVGARERGGRSRRRHPPVQGGLTTTTIRAPAHAASTRPSTDCPPTSARDLVCPRHPCGAPTGQHDCRPVALSLALRRHRLRRRQSLPAPWRPPVIARPWPLRTSGHCPPQALGGPVADHCPPLAPRRPSRSSVHQPPSVRDCGRPALVAQGAGGGDEPLADAVCRAPPVAPTRHRAPRERMGSARPDVAVIRALGGARRSRTAASGRPAARQGQRRRTAGLQRHPGRAASHFVAVPSTKRPPGARRAQTNAQVGATSTSAYWRSTLKARTRVSRAPPGSGISKPPRRIARPGPPAGGGGHARRVDLNADHLDVGARHRPQPVAQLDRVTGRRHTRGRRRSGCRGRPQPPPCGPASHLSQRRNRLGFVVPRVMAPTGFAWPQSLTLLAGFR